ncbi:MAG: tetratricopeptide repeat protein [Elusimicrobiales bacterium]|nr:tetratricopeptide repeat protein [Elusimicrobiales bacterium]
MKLHFIIPLFIAAQACAAPSPDSLLRKGNKAFNGGAYEDAFGYYAGALEKDPKNAKAFYNAGDALYKLKEYDKAKASFSSSASDPKLRENSLFNKGNAEYMANSYDAAAQSYKSALRLDPGDEDAKHNLELALRRRKNPQQQQKQNEKKDEKSKNDKNKSGGSGGQDKKEQQNNSQPQGRDKNQGMSKEDADRLMQMAKEKEDAAMRNQQVSPQKAKQPQGGNSNPEQDW